MKSLIGTQNITFVQYFIKVLKKDVKEISSNNYSFITTLQLTEKNPLQNCISRNFVNFFLTNVLF